MANISQFIDEVRRDAMNAKAGQLLCGQLTDFAVHQITPEFINSMRAVGLGNLLINSGVIW